MSRKTTKSILSRDEISLFKHSEELKNVELYGNLYEIISHITDIKAITLDDLISNGLNEQGITALLHNKQKMFDNINREWYVESKSAEDPDKKIRCGLCNTKNRYLFYIRNRLNNCQLNVGSYCMTKFPDIQGYATHKYQLGQIQKNQREMERWINFNKHCPEAEDIIDTANYYFDNLPILLPYSIYFPLKETVLQLSKIYHKYIKYGVVPIETYKSSFELFDEQLEQYNQIKRLSDEFINNNIDRPFICKRNEINWMIDNKKNDLLENITKNNGYYNINTIGQITSISFVSENLAMFSKHNKTSYVKLICPKDQYGHLQFIILSESYSFIYDVNVKKFMNQIGAYCFFTPDYKYGIDECLCVSKISAVSTNVNNIIEIVQSSCKRFGCAFLVDDITNDTYLYYKPDKSIIQYNSQELLKIYDTIKIRKHKSKEFIVQTLRTRKTWITHEEQEEMGIDEKINNLYYHQYVEPFK